jgi:acetylglutamate kinase
MGDILIHNALLKPLVNKGNNKNGCVSMDQIKSFFDRDFPLNVQKYSDAVVGIKLSGKCLDDLAVRVNIVRQIVELKTLGSKVVVVHGGGRQITEEAKKAGIEKREIQGLRYTTDAELEIADRCVSALTRSLVQDFHSVAATMGLKISATGMSGYDGKIVTAELHSAPFEGSRTGRIVGIDKEMLLSNMDRHVLVMNSICAGDDGGRWNVNADDVIEEAAKVAGAKLVIMCSDTAFYDKNKKTISRLFTDEIQRYVDDGTFNEQLAPKVKAVGVIADTVCPVSVVNGAEPNAIDLELYTQRGSGTRIERRPAPASP